MRQPVSILFALLFLVECIAEPEFVPLFNGEDISGWKYVNGAPSTWRGDDGKIACSGIPIGVLCTERHYENYILDLEWRHMREGGKVGLFVHSGPLPAGALDCRPIGLADYGAPDTHPRIAAGGVERTHS